MLDVGWSELLLIAIIAVIVIGPEDIPKVMMGLGRVMRRFQYVKFALSQQFEEMMQSHDLDELRRVNFERAKDLPDIDESAGDLDDYNESLTRKQAAEEPPTEHHPAEPPEGRDD